MRLNDLSGKAKMKGTDFDALVQNFVRARDDLNDKANALVGMPVYNPIAMRTPSGKYPELDFLRAVSWVYIHHIETGGISIRYLVRFFDGFSLDTDRRARDHLETVKRLRTELQHNLVADSDSDQNTMLVCRKWYFETCGTWEPFEENHWIKCRESLFSESGVLLESLRSVLEIIETDDDGELYKNEWQKRVKRDHRPHEFDEVISKVKMDLGREHLDVRAFRKRYFDVWKKHLETLDEDYVFAEEARRLVETSIISDSISTLPITGEDIMEIFDLQPGQEIGRLRKIAQHLYNSDPCSRNDLIIRLQERMDSEA